MCNSNMKCMNCENIIQDVEIDLGIENICSECGCIHKCIDLDEFISRWTIIYPD